jgi:hypothetical protein
MPLDDHTGLRRCQNSCAEQKIGAIQQIPRGGLNDQQGACSWRETQLRGHPLPPLSLMGACMFFDERTNRLRQELAAMGLTFESNERADRLIQELAAEKEDQIEVVMMIISPLILVAAIAVFIVCFWPYDAGLLISVGAAVLTLPVLTEGAGFLIGKVGGKRATRRFKET